eukprot:TRINITY_DN24084_c0_g1_i1.p1 TRINITY_DN24084_c0_g1~~TRINITY_DN24084_c0_g1_i1.p1  ORF type:complete len:238 (-),score=3.96 TRINITY_DN24084_c0_g1_i1:111-824(-)
MDERYLDVVLVPLGLVLMAVYHGWLLFTIRRYPYFTVIGLNAFSRQEWVKIMIADPAKNAILAVQTLRNNIMASTLLATMAITLSSLIGVIVGSTNDSTSSASEFIYGNKSSFVASIKYFAILLCFLVAFLCYVQSVRYYAHVSFLVSVPSSASMDYLTRCLNRGGYFWSIGLRAFYLSFPLFLWIFGPIPMFVSCCVMIFLLYFLDITTEFTRNVDGFPDTEKRKMHDLESPLLNS